MAEAIALAELCFSDDPLPVQLTVFVDANQATPSNGQAEWSWKPGPGSDGRLYEPSSVMPSPK